MDISPGNYVGTLIDYEIKQKFQEDGYFFYAHFEVKDDENCAVHHLSLKRELPSANCSATDQQIKITFEFLRTLGFMGNLERLARLADGKASKILRLKDYKLEVGSFVIKSEGMPKRYTAINAVYDINSEGSGKAQVLNKQDFLNSLKLGGTEKYLNNGLLPKNEWE